MLLRASGELEMLNSTATMLGAFAEWQGEEAETELGFGDYLVIYSDGVARGLFAVGRRVRRRSAGGADPQTPVGSSVGAGAIGARFGGRLQPRRAHRRHHRGGGSRHLIALPVSFIEKFALTSTGSRTVG